MRRVELVGWLILGLWGVLLAWPASYWHGVTEVRVIDSTQGQDFEIVIVGRPLREFIGSYQVTVSDAVTGETCAGCEHVSGVRPYSPDNDRPDTVTISWWGPDIDYEALEAGSYVMETCWTIHDAFGQYAPIADKHMCIRSNVFVIEEDPDKEVDTQQGGSPEQEIDP
jgi:hypothetical protein